jgi:NADH-quinone oxidoreductase subunit J
MEIVTSVQGVVFLLCALIAVIGAMGVINSRSPVHSALSLVATLFAIAVLFLNQNAQFLAAVQVIVYTGAIVILILFVIMLLGVDKVDDLADEPLGIGFRVAGGIVAVALAAVLLSVLLFGSTKIVTGNPADVSFGGTTTYQPISQEAVRNPQADVIATADNPNLNVLGKQIFTQYLFAFEITAALLTIAVIGAVVLAQRPKRVEPIPDEPESLESGADLAAVDAASAGEHA